MGYVEVENDDANSKFVRRLIRAAVISGKSHIFQTRSAIASLIVEKDDSDNRK